MSKSKRSMYFFITLIICFLVIGYSLIYNMKIRRDEIENKDYEFLEGKRIVRVWLSKDRMSSTRGYQADKFNEENNDIYIMLGLYDTNDYSNVIKTAVAAEKGPDIMVYNGFELIKDDKIKKLNELGIYDNSIKKENFVYYNSNPVGVRLNETTVKFIWNKEIFKEAGLDPNNPPKTWQEVIKYSKIIKEKCPEITPLQFPIKDYQDFRGIIGGPSVNKDSIYTSFWNYNEKKYTYESIKNILQIYNELYEKGLLEEDFDQKSKNNLRMDFYKGNVAMHLSMFEDKGYFTNVVPLNFDLGITDLPKFNIEDNNKNYFISNSNFLVINSTIDEKSSKEREAIEKVFKWLTSEEVNKEILKTRLDISPLIEDTEIHNDIYPEYNDLKNFETEILDPSIFMSRNSQKTIDLCLEAIKGERNIDEVIKELNLMYQESVELTEKNREIHLDSYKK